MESKYKTSLLSSQSFYPRLKPLLYVYPIVVGGLLFPVIIYGTVSLDPFIYNREFLECCYNMSSCILIKPDNMGDSMIIMTELAKFSHNVSSLNQFPGFVVSNVVFCTVGVLYNDKIIDLLGDTYKYLSDSSLCFNKALGARLNKMGLGLGVPPINYYKVISGPRYYLVENPEQLSLVCNHLLKPDALLHVEKYGDSGKVSNPFYTYIPSSLLSERLR